MTFVSTTTIPRFVGLMVMNHKGELLHLREIVVLQWLMINIESQYSYE